MTRQSLVEKAKQIMEHEYANLTGIDDLAGRIRVSKGYLTRIFTAQMGISPYIYLTQIRMEKAKKLLEKNAFGNETIASAIGLSCSNYFCKVFKQYTGMTSTQYTRKMIEEQRKNE